MKLRTVMIMVVLCVMLAVSASCTTIAEIKALPDATDVVLTDKVVTSGYGSIPTRIYIEEQDRSSGVQVYTGYTNLTGVTEGKLVRVIGKIYTNPLGERAVNNATVTVTGTTDPLAPVTMTNKMVGGSAFGLQPAVRDGDGLNNVGLLIKTSGWVSYAEPAGGYVEIDDGSGRPVQLDVSKLNPKPLMGDHLLATGVVACKSGGTGNPPIAFIRPRSQSDVIFSTPTLEQCIALPVPKGKLAVFWLGQAGFMLKDYEGRKVVIDPYLSDYCAQVPPNTDWVRMVGIPIPPANLQPNLTLLTHDHGDHTDPWTLSDIKTYSQSHFIGPTSSYNHLAAADIGVPANRRSVLNRGQTTNWNGIQITAVYANHTPDSVGFVITMAGRKIYISGDTCFDQTLVNAVVAQQPDIMMVSMNGKYDNLTASQAATLVKACNPSIAIPMHYGMFAINTEDPMAFVNACNTQGVTARVIIFQHGGYVLF